MFWEKFDLYKNNTAFIDSKNDKLISYSQLSNDINSFVAQFKLPDYSLCLILTNNSYSSIIAYLSILNSKNIGMLLNNNTNNEFLDNIIKIYNPDLVIAAEPKNINSYVCEETTIDNNKVFLYRSKTNNIKTKTDTKIMLSTSGSTGSVKFVRLSNKNINANAKSISEYLEISESERAITSLPINYSFGLSIINSHLLIGASIILTEESLIQKRFWEIFNNYKATTFSGVPYTYQMLQRINFSKMELPSLRYFTQAGGHLVSSVKKYFYDVAKDKSYKFIVMYGQTEATARISYVPFEKLDEKIDSIGIAIPDGIISIDTSNGESVGELIYKGPNVMLGYAENRDDIYKEDELNGVLLTGDMGYVDSDGFFFVSGRKKRFLKVFGNRVNLDDIERLIENNFKVPSAVTGIDDLLFIVIEQSNGLLSDEIKKYISNALSIHHTSIKIKTIDKIPVSQNSKKDYQTIKNMF